MPCLNCGANKTIDAHLIPRSFVMEVKSQPGEKHLILTDAREKPVPSNTGVYDKNILCSDCDNRIGGYENYALQLLRRCWAQKVPPNKIVDILDLDGDKMVRFAAGIAWKYTATTKERGQIEIGPYADILKVVAFGDEEIPFAVDVMMARIIELDGDVYYYRAPLLDRKEGVNVVRFCVGGFVFFLKIDKRRPGVAMPAECWLRGRTGGSFLTVPGEYFEEVRMHRELAGRPQVRRFFARMREH